MTVSAFTVLFHVLGMPASGHGIQSQVIYLSVVISIKTKDYVTFETSQVENRPSNFSKVRIFGPSNMNGRADGSLHFQKPPLLMETS